MSDLSEREVQILDAVCRGETVKAAADDLGLRLQTAKNYLRSAYVKLGVDNRIDACVEVGMLERPAECGVVVRCTRKPNHRGEHGGFRRIPASAS